MLPQVLGLVFMSSWDFTFLCLSFVPLFSFWDFFILGEQFFGTLFRQLVVFLCIFFVFILDPFSVISLFWKLDTPKFFVSLCIFVYWALQRLGESAFRFLEIAGWWGTWGEWTSRQGLKCLFGICLESFSLLRFTYCWVMLMNGESSVFLLIFLFNLDATGQRSMFYNLNRIWGSFLFVFWGWAIPKIILSKLSLPPY